ncbi:Myosin head motor domain [Trinorchestia longiramus]|nr:Myosin head motor domain [Trinorchestia longiramus]
MIRGHLMVVVVVAQVVVEALEERWQRGELYTWLADVLIALNTNTLKHTYDDQTHQQYSRRARSDNAPHIFAVADKAHQDLMHYRENQTVVVTGESGSGKSFSFVKVVEHLCFIGAQHQTIIVTSNTKQSLCYQQHQTIIVLPATPNNHCVTSNTKQSLCYQQHQTLLSKKILGVLTVLDALGNAATELNASATRHVRHVDVLFSATGRACGLSVALTCLDKLRLTNVPSGEGNFHLLYYVYDGLSQTCRLPLYGLSVGRRYALLAPYDHDNEVHNANKLAQMEEALTLIGFSNDEVKTAYHILAAILHLGNMTFSDGPATRLLDQVPVKEAARQLGVDDRKLSWALCHCCKVSSTGDVFPSPMSGELFPAQCQSETTSPLSSYLPGKQASAARDALVQALYSRLVDTVVELVNAKMAPKAAYKKGPRLAVGVLDMAGFEATDHNGLEQLMVNVLNEQLQYYYNQVMFTWEMTDYESEGVSGTQSFSFPDNHHLLELFLAKRTGLLELLEECAKNGGDDSTLDGKLSSREDGRLVTRMAPNTFAVAHYVGRVKYDITNMVERNKDHITTELVHTLRGSSLPLVSAMFSSQLTRTGQLPPHAISSRFPRAANLDVKNLPKVGMSAGKLSQSRHLQTQGLAFRYSLITLLYRLTHSTSHFVR